MSRWESPKRRRERTLSESREESYEKRLSQSALKPKMGGRLNPKMRFGLSPVSIGGALDTNKTKKKKKVKAKTPKNPRKEITLPPANRPNFLKKTDQSEVVIKADFDDRWGSFLEAKKLEEAMTGVYQRVYFRRWKVRLSDLYCTRVERRNRQIVESVIEAEKKEQQKSKLEDNILDTVDLIRLARSKITELSQEIPERKPPQQPQASNWFTVNEENDADQSNRPTRVRKWHISRESSLPVSKSRAPATQDDTLDECEIDDLNITGIEKPDEEESTGARPPKPSELNLPGPGELETPRNGPEFSVEDSDCTFMSDGEELRNEATKILSSYTPKQASKSGLNPSLLSMSYARTPGGGRTAKTALADSFNANPLLSEREEMLNKHLGRRYKDLSCFIAPTGCAVQFTPRKFATASFAVRGGTYKEAQTETHFTTTDEESESLGLEFNIAYSSEAGH